MPIGKPPRGAWNDFPDAVIFAGETQVKRHRQYAAAKAGEVEAAKRLAAAFADVNAIKALRGIVAGRAARLLPVHAIENQGINRIPAAFAELLGERLGLEVETGIVQANVAGHTGASGWERLARPALFAGEVEAGRLFVLVDDFVGQGGTLANLRGYLNAGGAVSAGAATLTGKAYSATLALRSENLDALRAKHGNELEQWWYKIFGYGFDRLTESEARYLLRSEDAHSVRTRLLAARSKADG